MLKYVNSRDGLKSLLSSHESFEVSAPHDSVCPQVIVRACGDSSPPWKSQRRFDLNQSLLWSKPQRGSGMTPWGKGREKGKRVGGSGDAVRDVALHSPEVPIPPAASNVLKSVTSAIISFTKTKALLFLSPSERSRAGKWAAQDKVQQCTPPIHTTNPTCTFRRSSRHAQWTSRNWEASELGKAGGERVECMRAGTEAARGSVARSSQEAYEYDW